MKKTFKVTQEITVEIPDSKLQMLVKELQTDEITILRNIAFHGISHGGDFVEGIGDIHEYDIYWYQEPFTTDIEEC